MTAILDGGTCPLMTFCLKEGFLRSPRFDTRLLILILYLFPVSLNSENTRESNKLRRNRQLINKVYLSSIVYKVCTIALFIIKYFFLNSKFCFKDIVFDLR